MNRVGRFGRLVVAIVFLATSNIARAETVTFDLEHTLGPINGVFGQGQSLSDHAEFFPDRPITINVGDTLIFNILFDQRLHIFDFEDETPEVFTFGLNILPGDPGYSGTWTSSIEAIGGTGDIWAGAITISWQGGGAGFGWGGVGLAVTSSEGSFTGVRWTTTITSANEGVPMTLYAFTGFSGSADGFRKSALDVPVTIDIKPGKAPNSINPTSKQKTAVAVLTTESFDALQVDFETVEFGPNGATESHGRAHVKDVDDDGDMDMVLHFNTQDTGIVCGDTEATLTGETFGGEFITGSDSIVTVNCD